VSGVALGLVRDAERLIVEGSTSKAIKRLEKAIRELRGARQQIPEGVEVGASFEMEDGSRRSNTYVVTDVVRGKRWSVTGERMVRGVVDRVVVRAGDRLRWRCIRLGDPFL
jgi:hypothetical protein